MAPVWPVIPQQLAAEAVEQLERAADDVGRIRGRCAGFPHAPLGELQRAGALLDAARAWFAVEAAEKPAGDRVFAVLPRSAPEAATVETIARAAEVAPTTARRHLQALVDAKRACTVWKDHRRATRYYRNPLAGERTTNGA